VTDDALDPQTLDACLQALARARDLPGDDPRVLALEQASAWLRSDARQKRRQQRRSQRQQHDRDLLDQSTIHQPAASPAPASPAAEPRALLQGRLCYVCKQNFTVIDHHYRDLCPACAAFNHEKRAARADLRGRRALVTGGRIKIGHEAALWLLRCGAAVTITTRFPRDAAARLDAAPDADQWRDRVQVLGLDLRDLRGVLDLCQSLLTDAPLDIVIHNAAQTVRRPPAYYRGLAQGEQAPPRALPLAGEREPLSLLRGERGLLAAFYGACLEVGDDPLFPAGALDVEGKPLDLRPRHTWRMLLDEVEPVEMVEVWLVNVLAPAVMNSQLRPLLRRSPFADRYIVNVSAVEGQFAFRHKTPHHPHTNMAKAALNMMTRTCGQDYARDGIYMTSVDTGWITDENAEPVRAASRGRGFLPPLDILDGAARVVDPILRGVHHGERLAGVFLKDYQVAPW
jgi:NAD(P)-dependent dehydrogenase (short-subunit alcohol dehydrogenase family)